MPDMPLGSLPPDIWQSPIGPRQDYGHDPELRAYEPTWRDRIANFLLPDQPSYHAGEIMRGLLGSSGIGNTGSGAIDYVPGVGPALNAQEAIQHGDIPEAAGQIAAAAVPAGALAGRVLAPAAGPLMRAVTAGGTGLAAGTAAALGLSPGEAEAEQKNYLYGTHAGNLTPAEQALFRQLSPQDKINFLEKKTAAERVQAAKDAEAQRAVRSESERAQMAQRLQLEQEAARNEARIAEENRVAGLPFRQAHPLAAALIQGGTMVGAAAVPWGIGGAQRFIANRATKQWGQLADRAEQAIQAGDLSKARTFANELAARNAAFSAPPPPSSALGTVGNVVGKGAVLNAPLMPFEGGTVIPNAWDYYSHPEGTPAHEHAARELTTRLPQNLAVSVAEGIPLASLGGKMPSIFQPARPSPLARSQSLVRSYEEAFPAHVRDPSLPAPAPLSSLPSRTMTMPATSSAPLVSSPSRTMQDVMNEMEELRRAPSSVTTLRGKSMADLVNELRALRNAP